MHDSAGAIEEKTSYEVAFLQHAITEELSDKRDSSLRVWTYVFGQICKCQEILVIHLYTQIKPPWTFSTIITFEVSYMDNAQFILNRESASIALRSNVKNMTIL